MLTFKEVLIKELRDESEGTRKMLALVPMDMATWKPHSKSMPMKDLAIHIADIPSWISMALTTDELDFAVSPYNPRACKSNDELLAFFNENVDKALKDLESMNEDVLDRPWVLRNGDQIYVNATKMETIRISFCQVAHHRAQLGVYLRLLDIPIPGMYGPSADELGL